MIISARKNILGTVDLLDEDDAHHAVCEGHFGNGKAHICRLFYSLIHTECAADDKCDLGITRNGDGFDLFCELLGGDLFAFHAERDLVAFLWKRFEKTVAFFFNDERDLGIAFVLGLFFF